MSDTKNNGGPAFPTTPEGVLTDAPIDGGMTLRAYAAIKLMVPDSGEEWLDEMIRQSLRDDFAANAVQGILAHPKCGNASDTKVQYAAAREAYEIADAMLKAREQ